MFNFVVVLYSQFAEEDRLNNGVTFALKVGNINRWFSVPTKISILEKASNKVLYLFILLIFFAYLEWIYAACNILKCLTKLN